MLIVENLEIQEKKERKKKTCHLLGTINIFIFIKVNGASKVSKFTQIQEGPGFGLGSVVVCFPTGVSVSVFYVTLGPRRVSVSGNKRTDAQVRLEYGGFRVL